MNRRKAVGLITGAAFGAKTELKALAFDVFGTVVDWRSSIIRDGRKLGREKRMEIDWGKFADRWRDGYGPAMNRVRKGELPWMNIDKLHRMILDDVLAEFGITSLTEAEKVEFNRVWHRLDPWPDAVKGLTRLKKKFLLATLSNGNVALLANMAKWGGLPWDVVLSAELFKHYKPDPEVYLGAAAILDLRPDQVLMVAAHAGDLRAAAAAGLKTAFVPRPLERGPGGKSDTKEDPSFDVMVKDFVELAAQLAA
jgi:2-haloacid dehalogenase